ncbi:MAG: acetyl-CoA carboxylase biotin carboxyl carrier protein [Acidobacteria bacterium]|nr:acetyl-CoA carboxylase biotin carboxyl carrier protein [Acidobacteriota bacterium]
MNLKDIKELIEFVVKQDLNEFDLEQSGFKIRIRKGLTAPGVTPAAISAPAVVPASAAPPAGGADLSRPTAPVKAENATDLHIIKSPIVGTVYRSPSPDAEPFVRIGDFVEKGLVLCIIEAMKLMNEIESDISGEVAEIYVESGQPVEYGEPLFGIRIRS